MSKFILSDIDLHLFDEGAEMGVAPQAESGAVVDEGTENSEPTRDYDAEFEGHINGEYKDAFHKRTQAIIDKRFKKYKDVETKLSKYSETMEYLMEKYEVDSEDELLERLNTESIEDLAYRKNMDPETYREYRRGQKALQLTQAEQENQRIANKWRQEEADVKAEYPEFNLAELLSRSDETAVEFFRLAKSGIIPLKKAYEITHLDNVKKTVAKQAEEATIRNIQAKGVRPKEAAAAAKDGNVVQKNVSSLTPKERAELAQRALRGETVKLGR